MTELEQYHYEQAKRWLEHVRGLAYAADAARRAVEYERSRLENMRSADYAHERVSGSAIPLDQEEIIDRIRENIKHFCANEAAWTEQRRDAYDRLNNLSSRPEAKALQLRYCMNNSWAFVCGAMNYTESGIMKLRKQATLHAYDVMPLDWRDPGYNALEG